MSKHKHRWQTVMHLDGCHYHSTSYRCECGASARVDAERDLSEDSYSMVWMEPGYREVTRDERGRFLPKAKRRVEEVECERCTALKDGAAPVRDLVIWSKDGTVEREEHNTA